MNIRQIESRELYFIDNSFIKFDKNNTAIYGGKYPTKIMHILNRAGIQENYRRFIFICQAAKKADVLILSIKNI